MFTVGDPVPWFEAPTPLRPDFSFASAAGRYVVLSFIGSAALPAMAAMLGRLKGHALFDDDFAAVFAVSCDTGDEREGRIAQHVPGFRVFWDFKAQIAAAYGLVSPGAKEGSMNLAATTFVLDGRMRVLAVMPIDNPATHDAQLIEFLSRLPKASTAGPAPVLVLPRLFEPEFCKALIAVYRRDGGKPSGFMRTDPNTGKTILKLDLAFKRRQDCELTDPALIAEINARLSRRLVPELRKVFQFEATHMERYIVARYEAGEGGFFRAHRDNTTKGTAHRRFAVTVNLNAEEYEGGDLCFPEFGWNTYRAPTGGAVAFSCSLLHEATPVKKGERYCFLPFLYDEAAAKIREENLKFLDTAAADPKPVAASEPAKAESSAAE